jgi:hypothetical protein
MKCARLTCHDPAAFHCRAKFASGKVVEADLCATHAFGFEDGLLRNPATVSGSRSPIRQTAKRAA